MTGAEAVVRRLRDYGVRHVFGYPGGPLMPLYDALYHESRVRHILARDEQAATFMADGYSRATGRPGISLAVCGPGAYNAATPIATAHSDSIPVLLLSGQLPSTARGPRSGYYHENEQGAAFAHFTKWRGCVGDAGQLVPLLDQAWLALTTGRPGPVLLDLPIDVLRADLPGEPRPQVPAEPRASSPKPSTVESLSRLVSGWQRPLLLAGGGVIAAEAERELARLADRLGAPVFHTFMGKCAISHDHPGYRGLPWLRLSSDATATPEQFSPLFTEADGLLAVGCRFTQVSTGTWGLRLPPSVAQIDIDPAEIGRHYPVTLGVPADAKEILRALLAALPETDRRPWAPPRPPREPWLLGGMDLCGVIRRCLPRDTIIAADVTQLAYRMLAEFPVYEPRTFLHPAAFVAMGYGIPAALGAKAASPERTVVAVVGDGCFMMSGMELATAVQEKLPIVVLLVNDSGLTLIKALQQRRYGGRLIGVELRNPDFGRFAEAFGVRYWLADSEPALESALREAVASAETALVELRLPSQ